MKANPLVFNFHSDPGHGWLEVPKLIVRGLGAAVCNAISFYSYQDKMNLYLEEDCDASLVIDALKKMGYEVQFKEVNYNNECFIRNLKRVNC